MTSDHSEASCAPPAVSNEPFGELPDDLRALVKVELRPGERLLWAARPVRPPAGTIGPQTAGTVTAWLLGSGGMSLGGIAYVLGTFGPVSEVAVPLVKLGILFGGIVAVIAFSTLAIMLSGRASARKQSASVTYALTDSRAILWRPRRGTGAVEVYTIPAHTLESIHRVEFPDGSGDVVFSGPNAMPWNAQGFLGVADVRRVEALAREYLIDPNPRPARREEYD